MGYFKDALRGISWMGTLRGFTRGLGFAKILILARILAPSQFGLFGIAMFALTFLEIITETGVNIFLIQEKQDSDKYISTAWIVSIARGMVIGLLLIALAPAIAFFFKVPEAKNVIFLLAVVPLIRGFINPSVIKFQKNLLFAKEFWYRLSMYAVDASVAVVLALKFRSVYCLVFGLIAGAVFETVASYFIVKPRPRFCFDRKKFKSVVGRGKWVTVAGVLNYAFENFDDAAVGRILDTSSLGIYQMAYKITSLPMTEVSDVIQKVTFPVYARISGDLIRLKKAFLKSLGATALLVLPIGAVLFVFPAPLVKLALGEKWLMAVGVVRIMAFYGVVRALIESCYPLFLALKKQKYVSYILMLSLIFLLISIVPLVKTYGIVGAGLAGVVGATAGLLPTVFLLVRVFKKR